MKQKVFQLKKNEYKFKYNLSALLEKWYDAYTQAVKKKNEINRDVSSLSRCDFSKKYSMTKNEWQKSSRTVAFSLPLCEFSNIVDFEANFDDFDPVTYILWHIRNTLNGFDEIVSIMLKMTPDYSLDGEYVYWSTEP